MVACVLPFERFNTRPHPSPVLFLPTTKRSLFHSQKDIFHETGKKRDFLRLLQENA